MNFVGLLHAGPTVIVEGTPEQRARFLPPILRGDEVWCQGFSEPGAGSDLASLRTRAVRDGDEYVVTGQKIWTSHAEVADFCELLVRTGEDSATGASRWLILPMDRPGIDFRPLRTIAGSTEFGELFLDEVRVPVANRVGDENDGWRVTMTTLSFERGTAFVGEVLQSHGAPAGSCTAAGRSASAAGRRRCAATGRPSRWPSSTRCGPWPGATCRRRRAPASPASAAACTSWRCRSCASASASSAWTSLDRAALCSDPPTGADGAAVGNLEI